MILCTFYRSNFFFFLIFDKPIIDFIDLMRF